MKSTTTHGQRSCIFGKCTCIQLGKCSRETENAYDRRMLLGLYPHDLLKVAKNERRERSGTECNNKRRSRQIIGLSPKVEGPYRVREKDEKID
jgi:hypothetical protein